VWRYLRISIIDFLQVAGVAVLLGEAQQDHRLGNEDAAFRLALGCVLVG
jgi:hypothetical protein